MKQELGSPQLQFLHNATHKYIACCSMKMSARPTAYLGRLILKAISSTSTVQNYHIFEIYPCCVCGKQMSRFLDMLPFLVSRTLVQSTSLNPAPLNLVVRT